jgi:hypothetical protein
LVVCVFLRLGRQGVVVYRATTNHCEAKRGLLCEIVVIFSSVSAPASAFLPFLSPSVLRRRAVCSRVSSVIRSPICCEASSILRVVGVSRR